MLPLKTSTLLTPRNGITGLDDEDVTLTDTTLDAAVLNTLDGNTSGTIDASSINTLTGAADDLINAFASNGITGLGDEAVNVDSGTATTDQANTLADATSAVVTATLSDGDLETLADLNETGNAYTITITDTSVDAAALNTLDGKTTVAINAANITTLTGAAEISTPPTPPTASQALMTRTSPSPIHPSPSPSSTPLTATPQAPSMPAPSTPSPGPLQISTPPTPQRQRHHRPDDEDITLSDTTLDVSILNTLDGNTSGTIDASSINTLTGAAADLNTAYDSTTTAPSPGLDDEDVTLSDTTLDAPILNTLDGHTSGTIDASSINTLTGAADALITAYASDGSGISGLGNEAVNVSSGTATTDQANTLATATSAVVTATLSDGDMATLAGLSETGNAYSITITDTSVDAAALNTLDGKTTVAIDTSNITTLTGAASDLNTAYEVNGFNITGLNNENVTLSDTTLDVSVLNTLDTNTSGTIDASSINTLTGAAADLNTAYDSGGITGLEQRGRHPL